MLESYSRCWKDAVKSKRNYSLFVRAREDIGFLDKISTSVFEPMAPHSIVTSSCRVNSGINDRFAFISPDSAECYFNTPFVRYYDGDHLGFGIFNTEAMFKVSTHERQCPNVYDTLFNLTPSLLNLFSEYISKTIALSHRPAARLYH
jgi:hypothetical protein